DDAAVHRVVNAHRKVTNREFPRRECRPPWVILLSCEPGRPSVPRTLTLICSLFAAAVWLAPSAAAQVPVNPPYWEYVTSLDAARLQVGARSAGGELGAVGGYECTSTDLYTCDGAVTADVRSFDLGSREWTTRPSL